MINRQIFEDSWFEIGFCEGRVWDGTDVDSTCTIESVGNTGKILTPGKTLDVRTGLDLKKFPFLSRNLVILITDRSTLAGLRQPIMKIQCLGLSGLDG